MAPEPDRSRPARRDRSRVPDVRDRRRVPRFELIAELAAFTSGPARASLESGKTLDPRGRAAGRRRADPARRALRVRGVRRARRRSPSRPTRRAGSPSCSARSRRWTPTRLRRRLLGADSAMARSMVSDGAIDRAIDGRPRRAIGDRGGVRRPSSRPAGDRATARRRRHGAQGGDPLDRRRLGSARLGRGSPPRSLAAIDRDAGRGRPSSSVGSDAREVLRTATRGVSYEPPPWIALDRHRRRRSRCGRTSSRSSSATRSIFLCSVADEAFEPTRPRRRNGSSRSPPRSATSSGSGSSRLRATRPLTASEIADRMGVDRTSLHHHLGILALGRPARDPRRGARRLAVRPPRRRRRAPRVGAGGIPPVADRLKGPGRRRYEALPGQRRTGRSRPPPR